MNKEKKGIKIAVSGSHSQGKTTLVNALEQLPEFKDYKFFREITRQMKNLGLEINENASTSTQIMIMAEHYRRACVEGNCIYDRCTLDGIVYTTVLMFQDHSKLLNGLSEDDRYAFIDTIEALFDLTINKYDVIFYIEPELALEDDGVRTTDKHFFETIVKGFDNIINDLSKDSDIKIVKIKGTVEERIQMILNTLKENN